MENGYSIFGVRLNGKRNYYVKNMANKFKVYLECKISDIKNIKELGIIEV